MKTQAELTELKSGWEQDACWDIEDTEGFEDHREELLAFRLQVEQEWASKVQQKLEDKASSIGCPGNTELARYVIELEQQLKWLGHRLEEIENKIDCRPISLGSSSSADRSIAF